MQTFETPDPISVVLEVGVSDIHIVASDRSDTVVEIRASDETKKSAVAAAEQTQVDFADGTLVIKAPKGWRQWTPWSGNESIDVRIDLPTGSHVRGSAGVGALQCHGRIGECRFKAGVGNIHVEVCGPVAVTAGRGDIELACADGHVELKSSGAVRIGRIDGTATIKNSNGETSIHEITGDLHVNAANGNIIVNRGHATVALKCANGNVRIDDARHGPIVAATARGNVEVGIREGIAAWLDLNTAFGRVLNDLDAAQPPAPEEDAVEVRARTAYGDIIIRRATADAHDEAST
jgi:hypothetical protein